MSRGAALIVKERDRQKREEGYTTEHDDGEHLDGELAQAAACYIGAVLDRRDGMPEEEILAEPPREWPWTDFWKPKDDIRDLVRAGALIAAEIDKRLRALNADAAPHPDLDPRISG